MNKEPYEALRKFPAQLEYTLHHYKPHGLAASRFKQIIIAGLGGSGIGGQIIKCWFQDILSIPLEVVSDYTLPSYAGPETLLILCSYSGNTEETLQVFSSGKEKGCHMMAITTGGKLSTAASENNIPLLLSESGFQPRMALGYSFGFLMQTFAELNGSLDAMKEELQTIATRTREKAAGYEQETADILAGLKKHAQHKIVVVADRALMATGLRFTQQINENSKHEAFLHVLPEANHNVIESYYGTMHSVFFFLRSGINPRVESRFDFLTSLLEVEYHKVINLVMDQYDLGSLASLIYRLDAFSLQLADLRGVNATAIANIDSLKEFLEGLD